MITFEKQNNIKVAAIDTFHSCFVPECLECMFEMNSNDCHSAKCYCEERSDDRDVFFLSASDKRILDYKTDI